MQKLDIKENPYRRLRERFKKWGIYDEATERLLGARGITFKGLYTRSRNFKPFFKWLHKMPKEFVQICKEDPFKATDIIVQWVNHRADFVSPMDGNQKLKAIHALGKNESEAVNKIKHVEFCHYEEPIKNYPFKKYVYYKTIKPMSDDEFNRLVSG
ncbi:MAG: hypothetical protein ACE5J2_08205 [Nitrososphaerales archaeon]